MNDASIVLANHVSLNKNKYNKTRCLITYELKQHTRFLYNFQIRMINK